MLVRQPALIRRTYRGRRRANGAAFLANPDPGLVLIGEYEMDVAAAAAARPHTVKALQAGTSGVAARRAAVRTAILLAQLRRR